jgi:hypothetical protein
LCFHAAATVKVGTKSGTDDANNLFRGRQAVWNNTGDTATLSDQTATVISTFSVLTAKVPSVVATRATAVANAMDSTIASFAELRSSALRRDLSTIGLSHRKAWSTLAHGCLPQPYRRVGNTCDNSSP